MLLRLQAKQHRNGLPRRIPCEEVPQVEGTLIPQDKDSFGSVISHEENMKFIFEESHTFRFNQLVNEETSQKRSKITIF